MPELDRQVACTAHNITHPGPDVLSFSLLLGDQELEGAEVLDRDVDEQDLLFHVTERWLLPPLGTPAPPALRCLATMTLPGLELSRSRDIPGKPAAIAWGHAQHGVLHLHPGITWSLIWAHQVPHPAASPEPPSSGPSPRSCLTAPASPGSSPGFRGSLTPQPRPDRSPQSLGAHAPSADPAP